MKTTYKRKISKKDKWIMGVAFLVAIILSIISLFFGNKSSMIFNAIWWPLYTIIFLNIQFRSPAAYINYENNRLVVGSHYVNIPHILSLEESGKKGIRVHYLYFDNKERFTLIPPMSDKDKPRLLADILQLNANIEIK